MTRILQMEKVGVYRKDSKSGDNSNDRLRNWGIIDNEKRNILLGNASDTKESRNKWIDAVERSMEEDGFEKGQKHLDRGLEEVRYDGDYGIQEKKEEELLLMEVR